MVTLPRAVYDAMVAHVKAGYPNEACGILAGDDTTEQVHKHYATRNAAADLGGDPRTFSQIAPNELLAIWNEIDANDWALLAYYHSHPETQAYPSPRDIKYSQGWPGTYYLIFTLIDPEHPHLRAYMIEGERVREEAITIVE